MSSSLNGTGLTFSSGATLNSPPVTSITAGTGLIGGTITTSGTISLDIYTGTSAVNTSYPIGSYVVSVGNGFAVNSTSLLYTGGTGASVGCIYTSNPGSGAVTLSGTWRCRGNTFLGCGGGMLYQRVA